MKNSSRGSRSKRVERQPMSPEALAAGEKKHPVSWRLRMMVAVLSIAVAALLLSLLEFGLRIGGYGRPAGFLINIPGREAFTTNQKFGWRFFPPPLARTPVVCDLPARKGSNTYRIVVLGESAAMGIPEPALSFGQILRVMLQARDPAVKFEVVNAAITAINSHVILPIAADCARHQADLFVIYAGNNEVIGPYGAGTVFTRHSPSLPIIRAGIWFRSTRTSQLLSNAAAPFREQEKVPRGWGGMAMFGEHQVASDDPRLDDVYSNFRVNLTDTCRQALDAGAQVIVSTVATNLKDSPPFLSAHRRGLSDAAKAQWQALYDAGVARAAAGDFANAAARLLEAARLDNRFAELHYHLGRCLLALHREADAREHFILARDLDTLRFRADTRINQGIREVATNLASRGVRLADAEAAFQKSAQEPSGIPGSGLLFEHVHLNFHGNYLLAKTVFQSLKGEVPIPEEEAARLLAVTGWDEYKSTAAMFAMMEQPPFTGQSDFAVAKPARQQQLLDLAKANTSPAALAAARETYLAALRKEPDNLDLHARLADVLSRGGDHAGAAEQWRGLTVRVPGVARWHASLADELKDNKPEQAIEQARYALQLDPYTVAAHFRLGEIFERQGKWDEAAAAFEEWLRWKPESAEGHYRLGSVLKRRGQFEDAFTQYAEALRLKPDFAEVHNNWGVTLEGISRIPQAIPHYQEAVRLKPDFAEAHTNWGVALSKLGQPREAIAHYQEALRLKPDLAAVQNNWGAALEGLGEVRQAIPHYQEAVRVKPDFADAHANWGIALAKLGQFQQAIPHYLEAIRLKPRDAEIYYYLGAALEELGRTREAVAQYTQALRLNPGFGRARERLQAAASRLGGSGMAP